MFYIFYIVYIIFYKWCRHLVTGKHLVNRLWVNDNHCCIYFREIYCSLFQVLSAAAHFLSKDLLHVSFSPLRCRCFCGGYGRLTLPPENCKLILAVRRMCCLGPRHRLPNVCRLATMEYFGDAQTCFIMQTLDLHLGAKLKHCTEALSEHYYGSTVVICIFTENQQQTQNKNTRQSLSVSVAVRLTMSNCPNRMVTSWNVPVAALTDCSA